MKKPLRFAFAQINPTVGDLAGNANKILYAATSAGNSQNKCDLVLFPELALTGYPPEDLILKPAFIQDNQNALHKIAARIKNIVAIVGFIESDKGKLYNAAAWIEKGRVKQIYRKTCLPNYGVFDENRYFTPGASPMVGKVNDATIGMTICEDIWVAGKHLSSLKAKRPDLVVNISASPFHAGKLDMRHSILKKNIAAVGAPLLYCNLVGGQDELVFDGGSFVQLPHGRIAAQAPVFQEGLFVVDVVPEKKAVTVKPIWTPPSPTSSLEDIHQALVMGIRDYVTKNGFSKVALGVSGGIDSALVAALAVEALGANNVVCVTMPSRFNSSETYKDAIALAENLGTKLIEIPIQPIYQEFLKGLETPFKNTAPNEAEENIQARVRGTLLMALSNKYGWLVLTTGNKSEMSMGYSTLYGDMAGGFAVLKDVLKTTVFALSRLINQKAGRDLIPETTITRPPTAELRENQRDEDSLGAYKDLDPIIVDYVEENQSLQQIARQRPGKEAYAAKVLARIDRNEYKRRQSPPGIKITPRSFGRDHRMPITNRYTSS